MSEEKRTRLIQYGVCVVLILGLAALYVFTRDFAGADLTGKLVMLCDAFTIPGILLLGAGGLTAASRAGALDGLGYALGVAGKSLLPNGRRSIRKYRDYVEEKRAKKRGSFAYLLICGGASLGLGILFLVAYFIAA